MLTVLLVVHLVIALSLVGVVMLQKSEGGGLGLGGGGGMSGFMTGRSTANLLTRTTGILFAALMVSSVALTVVVARQHASSGSILDRIPTKPLPLQTQPASLPSNSTLPLAHDQAPSQAKSGQGVEKEPDPAPGPAAPSAPSVPLAK